VPYAEEGQDEHGDADVEGNVAHSGASTNEESPVDAGPVVAPSVPPESRDDGLASQLDDATLKRMDVSKLADKLVLGSLLDEVRRTCGGFDLLAHWLQGEFHHDVLLEVDSTELPGPFLVVATNCNGGVKEVLCFDELPKRGALWKFRCPDNPDFEGALPPILAEARTTHWFDPCELLLPDARSELRDEFKERQAGGGWVAKCGKKS